MKELGYYPFGMMMPGRKYVAEGGYRYGFNGKENDNDVKGEGNQQDYGIRIYDSRLGRWYSPDNIEKAWLTPYQYASNNPVNLADPDGNDEIHFHYITITENVSLIRHDAMGRAYLQKGTISRTYTYLQVIKDNTPIRFFVHKQKDGKPEDIEFYPNSAEKTKSGVTTSSWYLWPDTKDGDFTSLLKVSDDFPELKGIVLPAEFKSPNSENTQHEENREFWQHFFAVKQARADEAKAEKASMNFTIGVLTSAFAELAVLKIASGGLWLGRAAGLGEDAATINNLNRLTPKKGWFDVVVHGDSNAPGVLFNINGQTVNAEGLYSLMLQNGYVKGGRIRLISCSAAQGGKSSVAQELSNLAEGQVIAPITRTRVARGGKLITEDGSKYKVFNPIKE